MITRHDADWFKIDLKCFENTVWNNLSCWAAASKMKTGIKFSLVFVVTSLKRTELFDKVQVFWVTKQHQNNKQKLFLSECRLDSYVSFDSWRNLRSSSVGSSGRMRHELLLSLFLNLEFASKVKWSIKDLNTKGQVYKSWGTDNVIQECFFFWLWSDPACCFSSFSSLLSADTHCLPTPSLNMI